MRKLTEALNESIRQISSPKIFNVTLTLTETSDMRHFLRSPASYSASPSRLTPPWSFNSLTSGLYVTLHPERHRLRQQERADLEGRSVAEIDCQERNAAWDRTDGHFVSAARYVAAFNILFIVVMLLSLIWQVIP